MKKSLKRKKGLDQGRFVNFSKTKIDEKKINTIFVQFVGQKWMKKSSKMSIKFLKEKKFKKK
jgi:hypothetical protein